MTSRQDRRLTIIRKRNRPALKLSHDFRRLTLMDQRVSCLHFSPPGKPAPTGSHPRKIQRKLGTDTSSMRLVNPAKKGGGLAADPSPFFISYSMPSAAHGWLFRCCFEGRMTHVFLPLQRKRPLLCLKEGFPPSQGSPGPTALS